MLTFNHPELRIVESTIKKRSHASRTARFHVLNHIVDVFARDNRNARLPACFKTWLSDKCLLFLLWRFFDSEKFAQLSPVIGGWHNDRGVDMALTVFGEKDDSLAAVAD